jgi:hypothetical protein
MQRKAEPASGAASTGDKIGLVQKKDAAGAAAEPSSGMTAKAGSAGSLPAPNAAATAAGSENAVSRGISACSLRLRSLPLSLHASSEAQLVQTSPNVSNGSTAPLGDSRAPLNPVPPCPVNLGPAGVPHPDPQQQNGAPPLGNLASTLNADARKERKGPKPPDAYRISIANCLSAPKEWADPNPHGQWTYVRESGRTDPQLGPFCLLPVVVNKQHFEGGERKLLALHGGDIVHVEIGGTDGPAEYLLLAPLYQEDASSNNREWLGLVQALDSKDLSLVKLPHVKPTGKVIEQTQRQSMVQTLATLTAATLMSLPRLDRRKNKQPAAGRSKSGRKKKRTRLAQSDSGAPEPTADASEDQQNFETNQVRA